ncbi:MAG: radical SAM protein [Clostridium sp.]|nr:radical SAM protein [Clostridium sp.]
MKNNNSITYDIILIQPPLFSPNNKKLDLMDPASKIEFHYWHTMENKCGRLLGDLPVEASYGILSIASYLKSKGYSVKILDFHFEDFYKRKYESATITQEDIEAELTKYNATYFGISVMTIAENWANKITNFIRKVHNNSFIFWGGYYPTKNDETILKNNRNIDFIVRNEGEYTIKDLICKLNSDISNLSNVKSLSFLKDNKLFRTEDREIIHDLDSLPFLDYSLYEEKYQPLIVPRIYTARGCKNGCHYCTADNSAMKRTRQRSPKVVVDEIENVMKKYNKKFFVMGDLEFLLDADHSRQICEEIIERKLDVKWWCQVYPPRIEDNIVKLMKRAGNIQIALGIESTNSDALQEINKTMDSNITLNSCRTIKKYGIQIQAYIMIGLPGDTIESTINTIKFVGNLIKENLIDVTHISTMVAYPGTVLYRDSEKYNITLLNRDPNNYLMNCDFLGSGIPPYDTPNMTNMEIYCLWLFALAHCQKLFKNKTDYEQNFSELYNELGITNLSILNNLL